MKQFLTFDNIQLTNKYENEITSKCIIFNYSIIYYVSCSLVKLKPSRSSQKIIRKSTEYYLTSNTNVLCHLIFTHGINAISFYKITGFGKLLLEKQTIITELRVRRWKIIILIHSNIIYHCRHCSDTSIN